MNSSLRHCESELTGVVKLQNNLRRNSCEADHSVSPDLNVDYLDQDRPVHTDAVSVLWVRSQLVVLEGKSLFL